MATNNKKISELTALTAPATGDLIPLVDVSDTTDASSGTTKYITHANFYKTDTIAERTADTGVTIDGVKLKDGGALAITGGSNTFNITNGTADLDLAAGASVNIDDDVTIAAELHVEAATHVNQDLTTDANPQFATVELGHASDSTITRVSAGILAVEGKNIQLAGNEIIPTNYKNIWVPASAMTPTATNGAVGGSKEFTTNDINVDYLAFDTTTEQYADFQLPMPEDWDRSTIKAKFFWSPTDDTGTTSNTVEWELGGIAISNDDAWDTAVSGSQVISDTILAGESGDLHITAATPAITVAGTPALGDLVHFKLSRNVGGTDDYGANALLFGCWIQYKAANSVAAW